MFENVGGKIKSLAKWTAIVGTVFGALWLLISIIQYAQNAEYLEYIGSNWGILSEAGMKAQSALANIPSALTLMLTSFVSSWPLYGFGQLIENSDKILKNLEGKNAGGRTFSASVLEDIEANLPEM